MSKGAPRRHATKLAEFLWLNRIPQAEVVRGTQLSSGFISLLASGKARASQDTIDAVLAFLTAHLGRTVTYEETFGAPQCAETAA